MKNKTINEKILLILLGVILAGVWIFLLTIMPDTQVANLNALEKQGTIVMIIMPIISAGLIICGLYKDDAISGRSRK